MYFRIYRIMYMEKVFSWLKMLVILVIGGLMIVVNILLVFDFCMNIRLIKYIINYFLDYINC